MPKCKHPNCIVMVDTLIRTTYLRDGAQSLSERRTEQALELVLAYCPDCQVLRTAGPMAEEWPQWLERLVPWARKLPAPNWSPPSQLQEIAEELLAESW